MSKQNYWLFLLFSVGLLLSLGILLFCYVKRNNLLTAVYMGDLKKVDKLLEAGSNPNISNRFGKTCLHTVALRFGPERPDIPQIEQAIVREIADLLIRYGADVNAKSSDGSTPLHFATVVSNITVMKILIANGADVNAKNIVGQTPLQEALNDPIGPTLEVVKYLIDNGADCNTRDIDGFTLLHDAVFSGEIEIVRYILDNGAEVNALDEHGDTPLHMAIESKDEKMISLLKQYGAKLKDGE